MIDQSWSRAQELLWVLMRSVRLGPVFEHAGLRILQRYTMKVKEG